MPVKFIVEFELDDFNHLIKGSVKINGEDAILTDSNRGDKETYQLVDDIYLVESDF